MKKFLIAFTALVVFASCNNNETKVINPSKKDFTFTAELDTCINVKVPVKGQINLCSGGKSGFSKIIGYKDSSICLSKGGTIILTSDQMNAKGWYYFPNTGFPTMPDNSGITSTSSSFTDGMPNWLLPLLGFLFSIALLALILWGLYELVMAILRNASRNSQPATPGANQNPLQPNQPNRQMINTENSVTVLNEIPESSFGQQPLFIIKNSGAGTVTVGDIHIHIGDGDHNNEPVVKPDGEKK